jgi:hypothetical protein
VGENTVWFAAFKAAVLKAMALGAMVAPLSASPSAVIPASQLTGPAPAGVAVFVGYADSVRANAVNFPTPWYGSPATTFEGCAPPSACSYDAGSVRVVNNSSAAITVNSVAVHLDTCTFTGWPSAILAPGADLVLTQLASQEADGCTPGAASMDTSDLGAGGASYGGCTSNGIIPVVELTVNGLTSSYADSGQVLNTGGVDWGICSGNESTQWTVIGHAPCRGSLLSLTPPAQSHQVLSNATVTATFTNSCGQPLSNTAVSFAASSGPNVGLTGAGVTNAQGQATFTYSSSKLGTDTWAASVSNLAGSIPSNSATVTWTLNFAGNGGSFVIGDLEAASTGHVLFWGAQWWKQDPMKGGAAPAAFKGFELSNPAPTCGQTWTTRPGNSPPPPATVPGLMGVIVSSHITQTGSTISGDIVHIVVVRTDPGYGPNPGHAGTGVIIGQIC